MTTALLQRSRAFVRLGGVDVDILTFDARPDYPEVERRLRAAGEVIDGMRLLNLYEWLRENPLPGGSLRPLAHVFTPLGPAQPGALTRTRTAPDGAVLQIDHFRRDGSLLLSDRRDTHQQGVLGGRSVVLCDASGTPVRSWSRIHHLYAAWLDRLTRRQPSFMIVDSKTSARFMLSYRRPHVTTVHVVHNSHLAADGGLRESRRQVFEHLDDFDSVVLLTERQRQDVRRKLGRVPNLSVIPNAAHAVEPGPDERDPHRGVVLASLTSRKRVDHAMRAAAAVPGVALDVYGDGELRPRLEALETSSVRLRGYRRDARRELQTASFLVATGSSEGLPLVLIEAMAAGCIPIAYDVPYGASDMIDGVNGVLVPSGDVDALAAAIRDLSAASPAELARRRQHARRTAEHYTDAAITERWRRELRAAARRHARARLALAVRAGVTASRRAS
jgi:poly(glycerol-phosphate) alpha-glucosyltransferase